MCSAIDESGHPYRSTCGSTQQMIAYRHTACTDCTQLGVNDKSRSAQGSSEEQKPMQDMQSVNSACWTKYLSQSTSLQMCNTETSENMRPAATHLCCTSHSKFSVSKPKQLQIGKSEKGSDTCSKFGKVHMVVTFFQFEFADFRLPGSDRVRHCLPAFADGKEWERQW